MLIRIVLASLLAAVVQFGWGFFIWAISGLPFLVIQAVPNDEAVVKVLQESITEPGVYNYPWVAEELDQEAAMEQFIARHRAGPIVEIVYRPDGAEPMNPLQFAAGFAHRLVNTFLVAVLLAMAAPALTTVSKRTLFVIIAGLFAAISMALLDPIWGRHPWAYPLFLLAANVSDWVLAAPILALVIKSAQAE